MPLEVISFTDAAEVEAREPVPIEGPAPAVPGLDNVGEEVYGINCSRGHFNNPASAYCSACGISMVHQTHNRIRGVRPTLGFLVFDDGSTYNLDSGYVIGRQPTDDDAVASGTARPLALDDPERSISRVHAEIILDEWEVRIRDRGSTNGTYIWDGELQHWNVLTADVPVAVLPGHRLAVGQRTFVFESPHRVE